MITAYLASRSEDRAHIQAIARSLRAKGIVITSRWLRYGGMAAQHMRQMKVDDAMAMVAANDLTDIDNADLVVVFSPKNALRIGTGGRHIEFGYAYGTRKPIVLVGERGTAFHYLPDIYHVEREKDLGAFILSKKWKRRK